jgi:flagellar protein FliL
VSETTTAPNSGSRTARTAPEGKESTVADKTDSGKTAGDGEAKAKGGGKLKLIIGAVVLVALLGGVYKFVLAPKSGKPAAPPKPTAGAVVKLDPITLNLAEGHFLKLGLSLQASADAGEEVDGAKALDAAVEEYSGKQVKELSTTKGRDKAKAELVKKVSELYENKVYDIYLTDFVMQ